MFVAEVWRGSATGSYASYEVPYRANQTILDVVTYIQRELDSTLSYRFACRVGMCGSCAMTVDGRPRWTCRTHISKVCSAGGRLRIAPLENFPVIKDLAVDMTVFFEKWQKAKGAFAPSKGRSDALPKIPPQDRQRSEANTAIECINCGVCYSACDTVSLDGDYLGPAALNRAWSLVNDERDAGQRDRLLAVSANGGCHACHSHQSCQQFCPQGLNPLRAIAGLKRKTLKTYLSGNLRS
jgi:fumarate reductase iron-sulfur subunit